MKRKHILIAVPVVLLICGFGSMRWKTVHTIHEIRGLKGQHGNLSALLVRPEKWKKINLADVRYLNKQSFYGNTNLIFYKYPGEGLPYFAGFIAYDTLRQEIIDATAEELGTK